MTRALLWWALLLPLAARADEAPAAPEPPDELAPTVGASLERTEVLIGDRVRLIVSAVAKNGVTVTLPLQRHKLGKLYVLEGERAEAADKADKADKANKPDKAGDDKAESDKAGRDLGDGRRAYRFVIDVSAYEVGELEVPAIELRYTRPDGTVRSTRTKPLHLTVRGLIQDDEAELQPLRPVRTAMVDDERLLRLLRWAGAIGGGVVVCALLLVLVRLARRRRRAVAVAATAAAPSRPADEVAIEKLAALEAAGQFERDGYRPFYFAVAEIVREFLGARFGFDALEMTSAELLATLAELAPRLLLRHTVGGVERDSDVVRFIEDTDLVKFANLGSTDAAARGVLGAARALVLANAKKLEEAASMVREPVRPVRAESGSDA